MMTSRRLLVAAAALLVLVGPIGPAEAQPGAQPRPGPAAGTRDLRPGQDNPRRAARRERVRQRIRAMRAWYLTEQLTLDDATSARLFPVLARFDNRIDELHRRGVQLRRTLRREMSAARPDPAALDRMVDALLVHYEDVYRVQRERFAAVRKVVTPTQSAKLLLLLPRIDDAIRRQIQRVMGGARKGARGKAARDADDVDEPFPLERRKNRARPRGSQDDAPSFTDPF
jgi:hypothetical protein